MRTNTTQSFDPYAALRSPVQQTTSYLRQVFKNGPPFFKISGDRPMRTNPTLGFAPNRRLPVTEGPDKHFTQVNNPTKVNPKK